MATKKKEPVPQWYAATTVEEMNRYFAEGWELNQVIAGNYATAMFSASTTVGNVYILFREKP